MYIHRLFMGNMVLTMMVFSIVSEHYSVTGSKVCGHIKLANLTWQAPSIACGCQCSSVCCASHPGPSDAGNQQCTLLPLSQPLRVSLVTLASRFVVPYHFGCNPVQVGSGAGDHSGPEPGPHPGGGGSL